MTFGGFLSGSRHVALLAEGVDRNKVVGGQGRVIRWSPSSRRAWIEILKNGGTTAPPLVALLAEGVDRNSQVALV